MKSFYNKIYILLFFVFFSSTIFAQNSGYLGKKFAVGLGTTLGVSYKFDYKSHNKITLDYSQSNRVNFRLSGYYDKFELPKDYQMNYTHNGKSAINLTENKQFDVNIFGVGAAILIYENGYVAPIGFYHKIEFTHYRFNSSTSLLSEIPKIFQDSTFSSSQENYKGSATYLSYGIGRRYIIKDNFLITFGMEAGFNLNYLFGLFSESSGFEQMPYEITSNFQLNNNFERAVNYHLNNTLFCRFDIGIGYLF